MKSLKDLKAETTMCVVCGQRIDPKEVEEYVTKDKTLKFLRSLPEYCVSCFMKRRIRRGRTTFKADEASFCQ